MYLLFFFLSLSFHLGNLQKINYQDTHPIYNTNKLTNSEPVSIQSISGYIYEENTREVTSNNYDRIYNKDNQPTKQTECINTRRRVGALKENPSILLNDTSTLDFNADNNTKTRKILLEKQKKEAQFDTIIIRNDLKNDHHNKYEHAPEQMSRRANDFEEFSDDSKIDEQKYKLVSQVKKDLNLSIDDNLNNNTNESKQMPKKSSTTEDAVHQQNVVSQTDDDFDHHVSVYSKNVSENYKQESKLTAERKDHLDRSDDENFSKAYESIEPFTKLNLTTGDQLDRSSDESLYKVSLNETFKEPQTENERELSDDISFDGPSRRNMPDVDYKPVSPQDINDTIKYNITPSKIILKSENSGLQMDNENIINTNDIDRDSKTNNIKTISCVNNERKSGAFELEEEDDEITKQIREPTKGSGVSEMVRSRMMIMKHPRVCFACSSVSDPTCWFPDRTTSVKYCRDDHDSCLTKTFQQKGTRYLIRDCGSSCSPKTNVELNPGYKSCSICHYDLCNGAFSAKIQMSIIIIIALFHLMYSF